MMIILYIFIFFVGLIIGSFLNVVICRLETGEGIVKKRSHCPQCGHVLAWYDLVPVLSFVMLRRRCRYCAKPISWQYPLVELATGLLFILIFNFSPFGRPPVGWQFSIFNQFSNFLISQFLNLFFYFFVISSLIVIFVYDLKYYLIPDKILIPAIIVSFIFVILGFFINPSSPPLNIRGGWVGLYPGFIEGFWFLFPYISSAIGASAFFLAIVLITRGRGMGMGDVKLAFLMGLVLGWPNIFVALLAAFASGAIVGLILIYLKRKTLKSQIPFGPFLAAATVLTIFWGEWLCLKWFNLLFS